MSTEGPSGLVNRIIAWADNLQRRYSVLGFPYAVVKKYGDDAGGRQAALITYYGFLSIFPLLLLGVAILSRVLVDHPDLRERLINEIVPKALRPTVERSVTTLPSATIPFVIGLIGLLLSGTGVVFSAYQTLNHVAAVRHRLRASFFARYVRVFAVLAILLAGALAAGALTVVATALHRQPGVERAAAVLGSALVVFAVLLFGAKLLLARPAPVRALWPAAVLGAVLVTVVLNVGAPLLARLVTKAGPVYGSFATVAGMFALLYLVGQALVYAAEVAAVRYARLWPRALDLNRPTAADARALALLAREQERIPAARVEFHLAAQSSAPSAPCRPPRPHRRRGVPCRLATVPANALQRGDVQDVLHVAPRGLRCLVRRAPLLARVHVSGVPVPPVVRGMALLVRVVMLGSLVEQGGPGSDVRRQVRPLPARQPRLDLLEQPLVAIGIAERGVRLIGAAFRVRARNTAPGQVEHLADRDAAADEVRARRVDVVYGQYQAPEGAGLARGDALPE